jgi:hypothetical protein
MNSKEEVLSSCSSLDPLIKRCFGVYVFEYEVAVEIAKDIGKTSIQAALKFLLYLSHL